MAPPTAPSSGSSSAVPASARGTTTDQAASPTLLDDDLPAAEQITPAMRAVRAVPLPVRRAVYERCRIEEEPSWFRTRSAWNQRRAHRLTLAVLAFEVVGAVGGLLRVAGISVDLSVPGGTGPG